MVRTSPATLPGVLAAFSVVTALLVAPGAHAQEKPDLAIMPFDKRGVEDGLAEALLDAFQVQFVKASGITVVGPAEIATVIGFEKQKELLGCDEGSCFAEIGGALGVRYLVSGRFAKFGNSHLITVRLVDARRTVSILQDQENVSSLDEQAFLNAVQSLAARFGRDAVVKMKANGTDVKPAPVQTTKAATTPPPAKPAENPAPVVTEASAQPAGAAAATSGTTSKLWIGMLALNGISGVLSLVSFVVAALVTIVGLYNAYVFVAGVILGLLWVPPTLCCLVTGPLALVLFLRRDSGAPKKDVEDAPASVVETKAEPAPPASPPPTEPAPKSEEKQVTETPPPAAAPVEEPVKSWDELDPPDEKKKKKKKR